MCRSNGAIFSNIVINNMESCEKRFPINPLLDEVNQMYAQDWTLALDTEYELHEKTYLPDQLPFEEEDEDDEIICWLNQLDSLPQIDEQGDECGGLAEFESGSSVNYSFSNFSFKVFSSLVTFAQPLHVCRGPFLLFLLLISLFLEPM